VLASVSSETTGVFHIGVVLTALGFGFRHGIDWDHIAALTDITSSQNSPRRSMRYATLYALGHALVVGALGVAAIVFAAELPASLDTIMERFVGATLIVLAVYVGVALARDGRNFRMRSRWMLLFAGARRALHRGRSRPTELMTIDHDHAHDTTYQHHGEHVQALARVTATPAVLTTAGHRHAHRHTATVPGDPFVNYGSKSAFGVGMIHGLGAETPTQILIFVTAAGAGGRAAGLLLLGSFIIGLLSSNTLIALAGTFGFLGATANFKLYVAVSVTTALFSLVIGTLFLFGHATVLPALFGG
jgi:hypothetical protein